MTTTMIKRMAVLRLPLAFAAGVAMAGAADADSMNKGSQAGTVRPQPGAAIGYLPPPRPIIKNSFFDRYKSRRLPAYKMLDNLLDGGMELEWRTRVLPAIRKAKENCENGRCGHPSYYRNHPFDKRCTGTFPRSDFRIKCPTTTASIRN
jgi:hypothetical protein